MVLDARSACRCLCVVFVVVCVLFVCFPGSVVDLVRVLMRREGRIVSVTVKPFVFTEVVVVTCDGVTVTWGGASC